MPKRKTSKDLLLILLLLLIAGVIYLLIEDRKEQAGKKDVVISISLAMSYPEVPDTAAMVKHKHYTLYYNEDCEQAAWAAYRLTKKMVLNKTADRPNGFEEDRMVATGSAGPGDYRHSGYHRGHLVPAADMQWSEEAVKETFVMSNISPMAPGFNMGLWKSLENKVRHWAEEEDSLIVICGPIISGNGEGIGPDGGICVPERFFKIIFDLSPPGQKMIAFVLHNRKAGGDIFNYATSVDELEKLTGYDFFHNADNQDQIELLEANMDIMNWN